MSDAGAGALAQAFLAERAGTPLRERAPAVPAHLVETAWRFVCACGRRYEDPEASARLVHGRLTPPFAICDGDGTPDDPTTDPGCGRTIHGTHVLLT